MARAPQQTPAPAPQPAPAPHPATNADIRQMQVAIASLKGTGRRARRSRMEGARECRRGVGALLATIEGRTQG